jgi:hypothetical protein
VAEAGEFAVVAAACSVEDHLKGSFRSGLVSFATAGGEEREGKDQHGSEHEIQAIDETKDSQGGTTDTRWLVRRVSCFQGQTGFIREFRKNSYLCPSQKGWWPPKAIAFFPSQHLGV